MITLKTLQFLFPFLILYEEKAYDDQAAAQDHTANRKKDLKFEPRLSDSKTTSLTIILYFSTPIHLQRSYSEIPPKSY